VDVLFRSAARIYGNRVIGVVLTGALDDGSSGVFAIKSRGGITIVQDPKEAMVPDMPLSAMKAVPVDYCVPLAEIAPLLMKLVNEPPKAAVRKGKSTEDDPLAPDDPHPPFVCPECNGPLTEFEEGEHLHFKCRVGHRFTMQALSDAHAETLERGVWIAIRSLEERAAIYRLRAKKFLDEKEPGRAAPLDEIAAQAELDAKLLREIAERI
jgi:two-component system chemotaxis response regulator CheB